MEKLHPVEKAMAKSLSFIIERHGWGGTERLRPEIKEEIARQIQKRQQRN